MELINMRNNKSVTPFNGDKYNIWKARVRSIIDESIMDEDALAVLDSETKPDAVEESDWRIWKKVAKGVLIRSLGDAVISYATNDPNLSAREILMKLDSVYSRKSVATELSMELKLQALKYDGTDSLANHFMIFDELVTDMESASGDRLKEANKIARLLSTLPKSFGPLVVAIQTVNDKDLNIEFVKMRLLDHEVQMKNNLNDPATKVLMTSKTNFKPSQHPNNNRSKNNFRRNYNNNFQKPYNNFKKNNRPNKYGNTNKFNNTVSNKYNNNNRNNMKCDHCGRTNHVKENCFYYKKFLETNPQQCSNAAYQQIEHFAFMMTSQQVNTDEDKISFVLDSGATDHLVNNPNIFSTLNDLENPIIINTAKKNEHIKAFKKGTVNVSTENGFTGVLQEVLYVPEIPFNLLSVKRIQENGLSVIFDENGEVFIKKNGKTIMKGETNNNLINVYFIISTKYCNQVETVTDKYKIWHERLGHINKIKFLELKRNKLVEDDELIKTVEPTENLCEACIYSKQSRLPFNKNRDRSHINRPLFAIHSDVCGPIKPSTFDDKNYFVTFIDEFTHYTVVYLISYKSEVLQVFKDFVNKGEASFNLKIAYLYCDNGTEYLSNEFKEYCSNKGIQYHLTVPYTPQQNSIAERMNRTLVEKARAMVHGANLQKVFWGEAILTAAHLINISPTRAIAEHKTPFENWHRRKPNIKRLRVFGSTVYVLNKTPKSKFDKKSSKGIFIGYDFNGYKVLNLETNKFIITRDVIFDENNFINSWPNEHENEKNKDGNLNIMKENSFEIETDKSNEISKSSLENISENFPKRQKIDNQININHDRNSVSEINETVSNTEENENSSIIQTEDKRRSARLQNKPKIYYNEEDQYYELLSAQSVEHDIPKTYNDVKNRSDKIEWQKAITEELNSLFENKTWDLVPMPNNKNIVECRWVFTIKKINGIDKFKYKARLVAKGYSQQFMLDYFDIFAPVARITTFRLMLAFAAQNDLLIHQMDVKTAFLHGKLDEEIYMRVPEGVNSKPNYVCKLKKALYGLKQAARCWFQHFDQIIKEYGFIPSSVDRCLYFIQSQDITKNVYLLLYVDDILIFTYKNETMTKVKQYLMNKFSMVDMKEVKTFLGINVERRNGRITLDQTHYLKSVLNRFKMSECKPNRTPLPSKIEYENLNSDIYYEAPCRELIGCLMYAMLCTRPDLCATVNLLSRYQNKNNKELWQYLKRTLRYIKGTLKLKLVYQKLDYQDIIIGFVDSDWAGNEIDRKSTTGYIFKMYNNSSISWNSKRQISVATSSTEAEYMALYEGAKEACWLRSVLNSINIKISNPITVFEDNNGCIAIANNPTQHKRSKHIDVRYHYTRELIEQKIINLKYISTDEQLADMFGVFGKKLPKVF